MKPAKNVTLGFLAVAAILGIFCLEAAAQAWREDVWEDGSPSASAGSTDSQQRIQKQPQFTRQSAAQSIAGRPSFTRDDAFRSSSSPAPTVTSGMPTKGRFQANWVNGYPRRETIPPGTTQFESLGDGGISADQAATMQDGCFDGSCDSCGSGPCGGCDDGNCCDFGWDEFDGRCGRCLRGLSVFVGTDAFKGPLDRGTNGNFGFNEGLNLARPLGDPWGFGYQIGTNLVQSDLSGSPTLTEDNGQVLRSSFRKQYFATAGIFRWAEREGLQGGIAYDYFYDMYYENSSLQQLRSDIGYAFDKWAIGYYGAYGVASQKFIEGTQTLRFEPIDMFTVYLQHDFVNGGQGPVWGGVTGRGDGLVGTNLWVPLGRGFAIDGGFNYLIPREGRGDTSLPNTSLTDNAQTHESWGLAIQLVWYPGQSARCQQQNPYRPMFGVANNSSFMVDRLAQ
jgi:hypothetical protein